MCIAGEPHTQDAIILSEPNGPLAIVEGIVSYHFSSRLPVNHANLSMRGQPPADLAICVDNPE
jgi:hypothetical protein